MKATKFFAMVAALLAVSCTNELMDDSINQNTNNENGIVLTLNGAAQNEDADSRIIVDGSKTGGKYIVKWRNEDAIGIFSADGTTINNVKAAETTVESGKTAATASFDTEATVPAERGDELVVYYPYNAATTYTNGKFSANVAASQETNDFTVSYGFATYAFAYDVTSVGDEGRADFALQHPLAYVKVQIETTDYVKNWKVRGVQIVDRTGAAKLAGDYTVDTATGEITVTNGTPSVDQYFTNNPTGTVAETATRFITLVTLPCDFTGSEVWVVAKFEDPTTGAMIYVPTKYENVQLKGGNWNVINLTLTAESNSAKGWYEPIDTRLMPGLGYAYGDQNTYLIQCKNGSTYTGATYTPNADIPNAVKVDIRGRGDFSKIVDVTKATFEWFKKGKYADGNGNGAVYVPQTSGYSASGIDPTKYTIDDSTKAEGYITVTNTGAYAGAPILLMKVDNKVVWAWAFWNIAADGTELEGVQIGDVQLANMLIGQPTMKFTTWGANKYVDPNNASNVYADAVFRFAHMYQWGRTMPVFWSSYWTLDDGDSKTGNAVVYRTNGAIPLADALARPVGIIMSTSEQTDQAKWCSDEYMDLWGAGADNTVAGVKSIYDPCPKGWRVADYKTYKTIIDDVNGDLTKVPYTADAEYPGAPGILYKEGALHLLAVGNANAKTAANGRLMTNGGNVNAKSASCITQTTWTNYAGSATGSQAQSLFNGNVSGVRNFRFGGYNRSTAMPVRCQKDTDNR